MTITLAAVGTSAASTLALGGFSLQVQIPSATPTCAYGLNAGGRGFGPAGGNGVINITTGPACVWSLFNLPNWIVLTSPLSGTGNGTLSYQAMANAGGARAAAVTITNVPFTVEEESANLTFTYIGAMPHLAAEENWTTAFTVVNNGSATSSLRLNFFGDLVNPGGNGGLLLPFTFPQQPQASGPLLAQSFERTLAANASLIVNTAGPKTPPVLVGSAKLIATGAADGFAIFHHNLTAQEAVVPMETRSASS